MIEKVILIFLIISASILKRNLDNFLSSNNGGEVIDIQFIPNYQRILVLEREKNQLFDLKNLINKIYHLLSFWKPISRSLSNYSGY